MTYRALGNSSEKLFTANEPLSFNEMQTQRKMLKITIGPYFIGQGKSKMNKIYNNIQLSFSFHGSGPGSEPTLNDKCLRSNRHHPIEPLRPGTKRAAAHNIT